MANDDPIPPIVETATKRFEVLDALEEEPMRMRDLMDDFETSRSTLTRAVRDLEDAGLVERGDGGYRVTLSGRLAARETREYLARMGDLGTATDALDPLPADAAVPVDVLAGAEVLRGDPPDQFRPVRAVKSEYETATDVRSITGALTDHEFAEIVHERVLAGELTFESIYTASMIELLDEQYADVLADLVATDRFRVFESEDHPPFALGIVERPEATRVYVSVGYKDGGVHATIRNDTAAAVEWAESFYEQVRAGATEVTDDFREP